MKLIKTILAFLNARWDGEKPLLLGYSGGPDSKALLYALVQAGVQNLHLAHLDHGWREESGAEAAQIQQEASDLGLVCHIHTLTERKSANLEEQARLARIRFFRGLFEKVPFRALLLAHHSGDLAETTLKRVFEGAHLCHLGGMADEGMLEGMAVWRPLLGVPKAELVQFLESQSLRPFVDSTNEDPRFLRTRLRREIIPTLEACFGKRVAPNLEVLSSRANELKAYLDKQIAPLWEARSEGPWGGRIDLCGVDRIVQRHLLQQRIVGLPVSREALEGALDALQEGSFLAVNDRVVVERGAVFWGSGETPAFGEPIALREGAFSSGDWRVEVTPLATHERRAPRWQEVWTGTFETALPDGHLVNALATAGVREEWRRLKVPRKLRGKLPIVQHGAGLLDLLHWPGDAALRWKVRFFVTASG